MKLYHTPTSPFVRRVMVTAHELGLADGITTELLRPSPMSPSAELSRHNPLSKIPALVLDDGTTLYDSTVICDYLDAQAGHRLIPAAGPERWTVLRRAALGSGILDAGVLVFYERTQRPAELHWESWIDGQTKKVLQGLDALEHEDLGDASGAIDLGHITIGCAIGWLEFRGAVGPVREGRPKLFAWYDTFAQRPSMVATKPVG